MIIPTDSTESVFSVRGGEEGFVRLTRLSDQRLAGYEVAYESSGNVRQVVYTSDRKRHKSGTIPRAKRQPVLRNAKPLLASAQRLATEMTVHAVASELIDLANDGYRLLDILDQLWLLRSNREPDWGDMVNLLRTAITKIEFERLSGEQCKLITRYIDECLCSGTVDKSEQQLGLRLLRKANLDPWRVLAQTQG